MITWYSLTNLKRMLYLSFVIVTILYLLSLSDDILQILKSIFSVFINYSIECYILSDF